MTTVLIEPRKMGTEYFQEILTHYAELRLQPYEFEPESLSVQKMECQSGIDSDEVDGIGVSTQKLSSEAEQKKQALKIARKLVKISDEFEKKYSQRNGGTSPDAEKEEPTQSEFITNIVNSLEGAVTPESFRKAVESVIIHATSTSTELALACELSFYLGPLLAFVPQVLSDVFNSRFNTEELENLSRDI